MSHLFVVNMTKILFLALAGIVIFLHIYRDINLISLNDNEASHSLLM